MTNEQYLATLVLALDWEPIGYDVATVDQQVEMIKLIRRSAIAHSELVIVYSQIIAEVGELRQENENLRLTIADAKQILDRVRL